MTKRSHPLRLAKILYSTVTSVTRGHAGGCEHALKTKLENLPTAASVSTDTCIPYHNTATPSKKHTVKETNRPSSIKSQKNRSNTGVRPFDTPPPSRCWPKAWRGGGGNAEGASGGGGLKRAGGIRGSEEERREEQAHSAGGSAPQTRESRMGTKGPRPLTRTQRGEGLSGPVAQGQGSFIEWSSARHS